MSELPSLNLLSDVACEELAAFEQRAEALDGKAGVLLGFSGVVVALSATNLDGLLAHFSAISAAVASLLAGTAFIPRPFPAIALLPLRASYLTSADETTRLRLLDTRIAMVTRLQTTLIRKTTLVILASLALAIAVAVGVCASIVEPSEGGVHRARAAAASTNHSAHSP
jgi:hypothetical protein